MKSFLISPAGNHISILSTPTALWDNSGKVLNTEPGVKQALIIIVPVSL